MPRTKMDDLAEKLNVENGFATEREAEVKPPKKKTFKNGDMIKVQSVNSGKLVYADNVSGEVYRWMAFGEVEEVEYSDLLRMIKERKILFKPSAIVLDKEFIEQNKVLTDLYSSLYTPKEIKDIFLLEPNAMRAKIESLPANIKDKVRDVGASMIDSGRLDSVQRIKVLDEIFGTRLLLKVAQ